MTDLTAARNARLEAQQLVPDGWDARVLEPSPPAGIDGDLFADDPTDLAEADPATTVRPVGQATTWDGLVTDDAAITSFAQDRWLGAWSRLNPVPAGYRESREDFHRLAYAVIAMARFEENGKFGLRYTAGGFGTPFFDDDRQVRMVANTLIDQVGDDARTTVPTTIQGAASFLDVDVQTVAAEGDSPELGDVERPLDLSPETGEFLGAWFGFGTSVIEELRATVPPEAAPERLQLWPGHFDPAAAIGDEGAGKRATFGASPGDDSSVEPYLYVGPWAGVSDDPFWNATSFPGATLAYADLLEAADQRTTALAFFRTAIDLLG